jgi:hypothetical protein
MFIADGSLNAASNAIKDSVLDPRGGGLNTFSVDLQRVGGAGTGWMGASWVLPETREETLLIEPLDIEKPSFQAFKEDIIDGLNMKWNTGAPNVQVVTYVHEDEFPFMTISQGWEAALADEIKKPWALERVQVPGEPIVGREPGRVARFFTTRVPGLDWLPSFFG